MIDWKENTIGIELQIEDKTAFVPQFVGRIGRDWILSEIVNDNLILSYEPNGSTVTLQYIYDGKEHWDTYKRGEWCTGTNDAPRLVVYELLEAK